MSDEQPKVGRPSDYTPELVTEICRRIAEGESLRSICNEDDKPNKSTVCLWLQQHKEFSDQYARAREQQMEHWAEEIVEISDDGSNDWMERETQNGNITVVDHEHISRSKLRVDTRKWLMSKLAPKKYGEKITAEHSGPDGGPIETIRRVIIDPRHQDV